MYAEVIKKLEGDMQKCVELIEAGVEVERIKSVLDVVRGQWSWAVGERDAMLRDAWMEFWTVWGVLRGQESMAGI